MNDYQHLLLPTDLTEASEPAAQRAVMMARITGAKLTVLHIVDYVPPRWVANELPEEFATESSLLERARSHLSTWTENYGLEGHPHRIVAGSPKHIIVDTAREIGADLIVMGTQGRTGLKDMMLGSTAERVVRHAGCPVLVVR